MVYVGLHGQQILLSLHWLKDYVQTYSSRANVEITFERDAITCERYSITFERNRKKILHMSSLGLHTVRIS